MKTMLQISRTKNRWRSLTSFRIFSVGIIIIVLFFIFISGSARSLAIDFFVPFLKIGNFFHINFNKLPKFFIEKNHLIAENNVLSEKLNQVNLVYASLEVLKEENQKLRNELGLKPHFSFITAAVIARPPQIPMDSLLLDRGSDDGLKLGDQVFLSENILIGRIALISSKTATIAMTSSADFISYGYVSRTEESFEIKGAGGGFMEANVPIDFDIKENDKIISQGSADYLIAVVSSVEEDKSAGLKSVLMSLPINFDKIRVAFVPRQ